jgi:hypothetical protein
MLTSAACAEPEHAPAPLPPTTSFSRAAVPRAAATDTADSGPPLLTSPDPEVLAEIIAAVPKLEPRPTGPDGGSLVGVNIEPSEDKGSDAGVTGAGKGPARDVEARVEVGNVEVSPGMPSPAVERAARAQLYYTLTMRCRDRDGKILPPDAINLHFNIDVEGYIMPSSISARANEQRHEDAANCMRRELSAATFRAPPAGRGAVTTVNATIPSVD